MPRISPIELLKQGEQPILYIQARTAVERLPQLISESYREIAAYLKSIDELMSDIPFVLYRNMDMQNLDVQIGFPVATPLPGKDAVQAGSIPAGKVVFCMYQGAYHAVEPVYNEMMQWIDERGLSLAGSSYEFYYNGPETPENLLLTKILLPLRDDA